MRYLDQLNLLKEQLKGYLPTLLAEHGRNTSKLFSCISPIHDDSDPSCHVIPTSDNKAFLCFGCRVSGDIFTAAHMLEGRPLTGPGFITDNLFELARRYGLEIPKMQMTDEERAEFEVQNAYYHAAQVIRYEVDTSQVVRDRLEMYGWTSDTLIRIGVGSVKSYDDYIQKMTNQYGHNLELLKKIDLANPKLFNPDNLIYTVKDEEGNPVGFACRNLRYEDQLKAWKDAGKPDGKHPVKYVNTSDRNPFYQKGTRLFNFNLAKEEVKHSANPLYVFEGYPDATTAWDAGLRNSCAVGATAFTVDHMNLLIATGVKHMVFVMDADEGGWTANERFVNMVDECFGDKVGVRIDLMFLPEGTDDPDNFIRKNGLIPFRNLPKTDVFSWRLKKAIEDGGDPIQQAEKAIPHIVNEANYIKRFEMAKRVSEATGVPENYITSEVMQRVHNDAMKLSEQKASIAKRVSDQLRKDPNVLHAVLLNAQTELENLDRVKLGYDLRTVQTAVETCFELSDRQDRNIDLKTDFKILDRAINGFPSERRFITVPGSPNSGKTTMLHNLAWRLIDNNPEVMVLIHSVDDALDIAVPRIMSSRYKIPSLWIQRAGFYRKEIKGLDDTLRKARAWMQKVTDQERLVVADVSILPPTLPALEAWVRTIRDHHPDKKLIVMGDNFHLFTMPGMEPGEGMTRSMSSYIKGMCNRYRMTAMFTMELPKEALRPGVRPRLRNIKGSSGMAYDSNANFGIYNDMKSMNDKAVLTWEDNDDMEPIHNDAGDIMSYQPKKKPIIELVIDKSKLSEFDGSIYYRLDPRSGHLEECSESDQENYKNIVIAANTHNNEFPTSAPFRRF